jgi:hypothetical protein
LRIIWNNFMENLNEGSVNTQEQIKKKVIK